MRIPGAWDVSTGQRPTVAVIDTGITAHPDLDANVLPGYDFVSDATAARDGNGRDTNAQDQGDWYAGRRMRPDRSRQLLLARHARRRHRRRRHRQHQGRRRRRVDAKIVPVRVLAKCGGSLSDIADAIIWASGGTVSGSPPTPTPPRSST